MNIKTNPATFSNQQLRNLAINLGVLRGNNIVDTIRNLRAFHHRKLRLRLRGIQIIG